MATRVVDASMDETKTYTLKFRFSPKTPDTGWVKAAFGRLSQETVIKICVEVGAVGPDKYRAAAKGTVAVAAAREMFDSATEPLKFERARRVFSDACVAIRASIMA